MALRYRPKTVLSRIMRFVWGLKKRHYVEAAAAFDSILKLRRILKAPEVRLMVGLRAGNTSKLDFRCYYDGVGLKRYELDALWYAFQA